MRRALLIAICLLATHSARGSETPSLILQIVVDNLPARSLARCWDRFGEDGFHRLAREGSHYQEARFAHGITFTAAGFATIATGASPDIHGIVANRWQEPGSDELSYCVEDERYPVFGVDKGRGPHMLEAETLSDVVVKHAGGRAFAISAKDRGAILLAGHHGKAFWYESKLGRYVTSRAYYETSPSWLEEFTEQQPVNRFAGMSWELHARADRTLVDDRPYELEPYGLGRVFPHPIGGTGVELHRAVTTSPYGERYMLQAVRSLLIAESIGHGDAPDYLGIGMSSADYVSHSFGPGSLEFDSFLLELDEIIGDLLELLDEQVGAGRWLLGLSADHGSPPIPEAAAERWDSTLPPPGRAGRDELVAAANASIQQELGIDAELAINFCNPTIVLDEKKILSMGLDIIEVEKAAAIGLERHDAVAQVLFTRELLAHEGGGDDMTTLFARSVFAGRSGALVIVSQPGWFVYPNAWDSAAMHGGPHDDDRHVPLFVMGPGVPARLWKDEAHPRDMAPSLAAWAGLPAPEDARGERLPGTP